MKDITTNKGSKPLMKFQFDIAFDKNIGLVSLCREQKSDNLQYNKLGRWIDGSIVSFTKHLMFFHNF